MFLGSKVRRVRRADKLTTIGADCLDSRQCENFNISQSYRPWRSVTGIALLLYFTWEGGGGDSR
jgi:hypothetical protein